MRLQPPSGAEPSRPAEAPEPIPVVPVHGGDDEESSSDSAESEASSGSADDSGSRASSSSQSSAEEPPIECFNDGHRDLRTGARCAGLRMRWQRSSLSAGKCVCPKPWGGVDCRRCARGFIMDARKVLAPLAARRAMHAHLRGVSSGVARVPCA